MILMRKRPCINIYTQHRGINYLWLYQWQFYLDKQEHWLFPKALLNSCPFSSFVTFSSRSILLYSRMLCWKAFFYLYTNTHEYTNETFFPFLVRYLCGCSLRDLFIFNNYNSQFYRETRWRLQNECINTRLVFINSAPHSVLYINHLITRVTFHLLYSYIHMFRPRRTSNRVSSMRSYYVFTTIRSVLAWIVECSWMISAR